MAEMDYDAKTALLIVDVQNDFVDAQGNLYVKGGEQVVKPINREIRRALNAGATVVYTRDWHPPETPHFAPFGGKWPVHCVRDTWGSEFHPDLDIATAGEHIHKATGLEDGYSAFSVQHLPTGEVRGTGLEAVRKGFEVTVLEEAVRAVELAPGDRDRTLERLEHAGVRIA